MALHIASWNVNSVKARLPHLQKWAQQVKPDVLLLQELKCETPAFPLIEVEALGYRAAVQGQKAYNGVAVLCRQPFVLRRDSLPGDDSDTQARYLELETGGLIVASLYVPNGNPVESEKFPYKLRWLERLETHVKNLLAEEKPFILGGDFNIIPEAQDVYDPAGWANDALYHPASRAAWRRLLHEGLTDAFRALHPDKKHAFTYWDYQQGAWQQDHGLRIDHFLLSPEAADLLQACHIDRTPRGWDKASDHTPVTLTLRA